MFYYNETKLSFKVPLKTEDLTKLKGDCCGISDCLRVIHQTSVSLIVVSTKRYR